MRYNIFIPDFRRSFSVKKFLLSCLLFMAVCVPSWADDEIRLGIMNFTSKVPDVKDDMASSVSDFFLRAISNAGRIRLVERERFEAIAGEIKIGRSGLIDSATAAEVGKLAGCTHMLIGSLTGLSKSSTQKSFSSIYKNTTMKVRATLDVRIVEVETGDIVFADSGAATAEKEDEVYDVPAYKQRSTGFDGIELTAISKAVKNMTPNIIVALVGEPEEKEEEEEKYIYVNFENSSIEPAKVVKSYGLSGKDTARILTRHKDAANKKGNQAKVEAYTKMFREYNIDYLAAYLAAKAEFEMSHGSAAVGWCNKALAVNPRYYPANALKKQAEGLMKQ